MEKLNSRHTAQYIGNVLHEMCTKWNIPDEKIVCVVTDNGNNMKNAIYETFGNRKHLPCFAHTLNLIAQKAIESSVRFKEIVSKIKHIVSHFKQSVPASDELMRLQIIRGKTEGTCLKLKQDCPTR